MRKIILHRKHDIKDLRIIIIICLRKSEVSAEKKSVCNAIKSIKGVRHKLSAMLPYQ